jgi:hypothetical protein
MILGLLHKQKYTDMPKQTGTVFKLGVTVNEPTSDSYTLETPRYGKKWP